MRERLRDERRALFTPRFFFRLIESPELEGFFTS